MPKYNASDTVRKLIVLLNNARELSVNHASRTLALDTIRSCRILCHSRNYNISSNVFDKIEYAIKNYNPQTLSQAFDQAEEEIILFDS